MKQTVYQHKVLPHKALVTSEQGLWFEFYIEDAKDLSYLEKSIFLEAYQVYAPLEKPLYKPEELVPLRAEARAKGILVPREFE